MITTSADLLLPSSKPHLIISHRDDCVHTSTVYSVSEKKWKHILLHKMGMATFSIRSFVATRDVIYYLTQRTFVVQQTTSSQLGMVVGMDTHAFGLHQAEHSLGTTMPWVPLSEQSSTCQSQHSISERTCSQLLLLVCI